MGGWISHWTAVTESKLTLLTTRQANERRDEVLRQGIRLYSGSQLTEKKVPQNNHLVQVWMPGSFIDQRESNEELKSKDRLEGKAEGK